MLEIDNITHTHVLKNSEYVIINIIKISHVHVLVLLNWKKLLPWHDPLSSAASITYLL